MKMLTIWWLYQFMKEKWVNSGYWGKKPKGAGYESEQEILKYFFEFLFKKRRYLWKVNQQKFELHRLVLCCCLINWYLGIFSRLLVRDYDMVLYFFRKEEIWNDYQYAYFSLKLLISQGHIFRGCEVSYWWKECLIFRNSWYERMWLTISTLVKICFSNYLYTVLVLL